MEEKILNALGNPIRLKLLCCLAQSPKNVEGLIENCGLSQSAVSQHLSKLKEAGLVKTEKKGRYVYYFLNDSKTGKIAQNLKKYIEEVNQMLKKYQNESKNDRIIRFILGIILGVISYTMFTGTIQAILYVITLVLLFTAITGFCLIYKLFGVKTLK